MINWQKIAMYILIGGLLAVLITLFIQNKRLESKVQEQRHLYILEKEKRIEANEIAFDSITGLNKELNRLIELNEVDISDTNAERHQKKEDYEQAVTNADTLNRGELQRKLSELFER